MGLTMTMEKAQFTERIKAHCCISNHIVFDSQGIFEYVGVFLRGFNQLSLNEYGDLYPFVT